MVTGEPGVKEWKFTTSPERTGGANKEKKDDIEMNERVIEERRKRERDDAHEGDRVVSGSTQEGVECRNRKGRIKVAGRRV